MIIAALCVLVLGDVPASMAASQPAPLLSVPFALEVVVANDPDFPLVTPSDAEAMFAIARKTLAQKFGITDVSFHVRRYTDAHTFVKENAERDGKCLARVEPTRVWPGERSPLALSAAKTAVYLQQWPLTELQALFPNGAQLKSYEALTAVMLKTYDDKLKTFAAMRTDADRPLLGPDSNWERSYTRWSCAMYNQTEADVVLTNTIMILDDGANPQPHGIFYKLKAGGVAFASPLRKNLVGRAVVASTFAMTTPLDFFREVPLGVPGPDANTLIGTFVLAHELGHAIFRMPDFYDHPLGCLMTSRRGATYLSGFAELDAHHEPCSECAPYVYARDLLFAYVQLARAGRYGEARAALLASVAAEPSHVDGNYRYFLLSLVNDSRDAYVGDGAKQEFKKTADAVLAALSKRS